MRASAASSFELVVVAVTSLRTQPALKSALGSFIVLPLLAITLVVIRFGFRPLYMMAASIVGEIIGIFVYSAYHQWRVSAVLSGLASGSVTYRGTLGPRNIFVSVLFFSAFGVAIALCVAFTHWIYQRGKSALGSRSTRHRSS